MQIFVKSLCGTSTLDVRASDSVDALTSRVEEAEGFPAGVVVLSWAGKVLRCGRALADYGVCDAATVTLLLRVSGGAIDFQNRHGSKPGSGGAASAQQAAIDQRERLRKLALETIDITKDPYFMRNHLGTYECKLCLTLHPNEGNYLAHTQGKRHQENLKRRAFMDAKNAPALPAPVARPTLSKTIKIGRPGYKVVKQNDPETGERSLLFEIHYPEIEEGLQPRHRFMSAYEQKVEPPNKDFQYLLFAADPYETIAFKIPNLEIDKAEGKFFTDWNRDKLTFKLQLHFKSTKAAPALNPVARQRSTYHGNTV